MSNAIIDTSAHEAMCARERFHVAQAVSWRFPTRRCGSKSRKSCCGHADCAGLPRACPSCPSRGLSMPSCNVSFSKKHTTSWFSVANLDFTTSWDLCQSSLHVPFVGMGLCYNQDTPSTYLGCPRILHLTKWPWTTRLLYPARKFQTKWLTWWRLVWTYTYQIDFDIDRHKT